MIHTKLLTKFAFSLALVLAVVAIVTSVPVRLEAQAVSGDLVGKITDASGAVIPNATVEAVNLGTSQKITTTTNSNGEYHFVNMPVGHYKLTATGNGLSGGYADVKVDLNKSATANITATVGAAATTVEVVEQAATIDTTTSTIQTNYDTKQAEDLPTASVGLGVLNLSLLQAGVGSSGGIGAGTGPAVSGQRPRNNNFTIEGVDNNSKSVTGPLVTIPNDAVESFTVLQNNFSPEFGHSSGGQFNTTIRSGSNKFHGRAYEYFQNRNLNAEDSQVAKSQRSQTDAAGNPVKVQNNRYDNNRFGGQVGGPIVKDKLFFFTNWEYQPVGSTGGASTACAPTAAGYATLAGIPGVSANNLSVLKTYLPSSSAVDTGSCGSSDNTGNYGQFASLPKTDPNYKPAPTATGYDVVGGLVIPLGTVGFTGPNFSNGLTTVNSLDFNPTSKDQIRFRYIYIHQTFSDTGAQLPSFWITDPARYHVSTFSEYHTFSPTITNEFRLGFNRYTSPTPVGPQAFPGLAMFPNVTLDDMLGVNVGPNGNAPQGAAQNTYQLVDNVSWLRGKHNLKFGMEGRKYISPQTFTQRVRGDYYYCGFACDKTAPGASSLDEYLRDFSPTDFGERSTGDPVYAGDQYAIYGFGNDEWRATSHLTINLGLRYEYTGTPAGNGLQALNSIASVPGLINFARPRAQKKNFAPRVGFAYSPGASGETSIRGGFAMSYDVIYDNLGILSLPPELSSTCDVAALGQPHPCNYQDVGFLANGGLPSGGNGLTTFATAAAARAKTGAFIPDQKLPYSEAWNLGVQHVFAKKYIAEVRYVGSKGIHLPVQARLNRVSKVTPTRFLPTYLSAPTQATLDALTVTTKCPKVGGVETCPAGMTSLNLVSSFEPSLAAAGFTGSNVVGFMPYGSSIYHGLQSQITRNFTNGLQFQGAWTWSHMFDNSTADVFSTVLTPRRAQDWNNFAGERSVSALDHRHRITLQVIYDLPFFKKDSNWMKKNILGNWELAPIYTFQSPEYATVRSGTDSNLNGDSAGDRTIINPAGNPLLGSGVTAKTNSAGMVVAYLANNPNAYYIQAGAGALATAHRNTLALPRINNWDLTAVKRFSVGEGKSFEFQAQALNVLNHSQYVPGSLNQINSLGYTSGEVTNMLQANQPTFAQFKEVLSQQPRSMQLALKFSF